MRRLLVVPVVAATLALSPLTGCASELGPGPAGPATALTLPAATPATGTTTGTTTGSAAAAPGDDDVAACADGDCEVRLIRDTVIRLDPGLDAERITVSDIAANRARVTVESGGSTSTSSGGAVQIVRNGLSIRLRVAGGVATLRLATT